MTLTLAMLHAYISISQNGNQTISGMAINIIASGLTPVLAVVFYVVVGAPLALLAAFLRDEVFADQPDDDANKPPPAQ